MVFRGVYPPEAMARSPQNGPMGPPPQFFPRCMECRRGIAMRKLRPSVRLSVGRKIYADWYTIRKII